MSPLSRRIGLLFACFLLAGSNGCPFDWRAAVDNGAGDVSGLTWKEADRVIAQASLESAERNRPADADTLREPLGLAFSGGLLFIADPRNHRVMAYQGLPESDNPTARFVLGQDAMTEAERGGGAGGMALPLGVAAGSWGLAVADSRNHRILLWNQRPSGGPTDADRVFGQPARDQDLGPACQGDALRDPWAVSVFDERLVVSDYGNDRLMVWDRSAGSGAFASLVIGQDGFDRCNENRGLGQPTAEGLSGPAGFWTDGNRLAVADRFNNRVLLWDRFPQAGEGADRVIGQPGMESRSRNRDGLERGLDEPVDVHWDGRRLYVVDRGNHRVLVYSGWPGRDQPRPDAVLGQPDRDSNQNNNTGDDNAVNARSLSAPEAVWTEAGRLIVSDTGNDRVLIYALDEDDEEGGREDG